MTIQRPPILAGLCSDAFVSKFASLGASSPPSPLRQMLDRLAAFHRRQPPSLYRGDNVIAKPVVRTASCVTISQVRWGGARKEYARQRTCQGCETRCGGEWVSLLGRNCRGRERHGHDQARAGRHIEANGQALKPRTQERIWPKPVDYKSNKPWME